MEEKPAADGFGIDGLRQATEGDATFLQFRYEGDQMRETPPKPVELPDDESVAALYKAVRLIERRSAWPRAGGVIREDPFAASAIERIKLERRVLLVRRNPHIPIIMHYRTPTCFHTQSSRT